MASSFLKDPISLLGYDASPVDTTNNTVNTNFNSDLLDGYHADDILKQILVTSDDSTTDRYLVGADSRSTTGTLAQLYTPNTRAVLLNDQYGQIKRIGYTEALLKTTSSIASNFNVMLDIKTYSSQWKIGEYNVTTAVGGTNYRNHLLFRYGTGVDLVLSMPSTSTTGSAKYWIPAGAAAGVGASAKPIYMNSSGVLTASSSTLGTSSKPIYMSSGTLTACSATVGSGTKPIYMSGGTLTASSSTVGSTSKPVYLNNGTFTECNNLTSVIKYEQLTTGTVPIILASELDSNGNVSGSSGSIWDLIIGAITGVGTNVLRFNQQLQYDIDNNIIRGNIEKWNGYKLALVTALPASPDANTIYFIYE